MLLLCKIVNGARGCLAPLWTSNSTAVHTLPNLGRKLSFHHVGDFVNRALRRIGGQFLQSRLDFLIQLVAAFANPIPGRRPAMRAMKTKTDQGHISISFRWQ